jgi:hypothetical protein
MAEKTEELRITATFVRKEAHLGNESPSLRGLPAKNHSSTNVVGIAGASETASASSF